MLKALFQRFSDKKEKQNVISHFHYFPELLVSRFLQQFQAQPVQPTVSSTKIKLTYNNYFFESVLLHIQLAGCRYQKLVSDILH
jgi:hypothetical protein